MKEVWELYGQTWSHYGGSKSFLIAGILAIGIGIWAGPAPSAFIIPLFIIYTCAHAGIQYRVLTMKHEGLNEEMRVALMIRAARLWWWFVGFTTANCLLDLYVTHFQPAA